MRAVASAYLAFLWIPLTPEKILTVMIAIFLLRCFFPKDEKTLGILRDMFGKIKAKAKKTKKETEQQVGSKEVNYIIPSNESKIFTKSQILEARRNFLQTHSRNFTKSDFIN